VTRYNISLRSACQTRGTVFHFQ